MMLDVKCQNPDGERRILGNNQGMLFFLISFLNRKFGRFKRDGQA